MSKLLRELSEAEHKVVCDLIVKNGFNITFKNNKRIEFEMGFRQFVLQSTAIDDREFGLSMSVDIDSFVKKNYVFKEKYTTHLQDRITESNLLIDEACALMNWNVVDHLSLKNMQIEEYSEEPVAENIYNVLIRNVNHIIVDDSVFEGNFIALKGFINLKITEFFSDKKMENFVSSLKKI